MPDATGLELIAQDLRGAHGEDAVVGTLFFLVPYNLLMYGINDVFDYASDLRNPRKGGIEGGLVAPERARAVHRRILWSCVVLTVPQIMPSASPFSTSMAPMRVVRRRISSFAICSLIPLRAIFFAYVCQKSR